MNENETVNAGQEDVADSPMETGDSASTVDEFGAMFDEILANNGGEGEQPDEGAQEAEVAEPQPEAQRQQQTAEENAQFAAARREAEAQLRAREQRELAIAQSLGFQSLDALEQAVAEYQSEQEVQQRVNEGIPEAFARRLYELERESQQRHEQDDRRAQEDARMQQWMLLHNEYPETRAMVLQDLPESVQADILNGVQPLEAYRNHELQTLREKVRALETNKNNREKAIGSLKGNAPTQSKGDPFIEGFMNG